MNIEENIGVFCAGGARPPLSGIIRFGTEHGEVCGIAPICRVSQTAPSTFYAHLAVERDPELASDRAKRDAEPRPEMPDVREDNRSVYKARKLWYALRPLWPWADYGSGLSALLNTA